MRKPHIIVLLGSVFLLFRKRILVMIMGDWPLVCELMRGFNVLCSLY